MTRAPQSIPKRLVRVPPKNPIYIEMIASEDYGAVWAMYACSRAERLFGRMLSADECLRLQIHYHARADVPARDYRAPR